MKRVLLDNCLDRRLVGYLPEFDAVHVLDLGWQRLGDSTLLRLAATDFDVFLTIDKSLPSQVNIATLDIALIVVQVRSNRLADCLSKVPEIIAAIPAAATSSIIYI